MTAPPATVGVRTRCCGQYARGAVTGGVAAGQCPKCGGRFRATLPPAAPETGAAKPACPPAAASR